MDKAVKMIKAAKKIAILTHISEDADAIGSAFAFADAVSQEEKIADIYISAEPESRVKFLGKDYIIFDEQAEIPDYDLCVCLDSADLLRLGKREKIFKSAKATLNIDHHFTNTRYADENYVEGDASSTGELIYSLIEKMGMNITPRIAECLYSAIASDTGCFKYSSVTPKTMQIAADLLKIGIDHAGICRLLFDTEPKNVLMLKGHIMKNIREYFNGTLCLVAVTNEEFESFNAPEKDTGDIVNIPRMVEGCEIAASIRQTPERIKVSFRSNGKYDVSEIAKAFGGGGHKMASGATITNKSIADAEKMVVEECRKYLKKEPV